MKNIWGDVLAIASNEAASHFVQDDEAGGVWSADFFVSVVDAGTGVEVEVVVAHEDGGVSGIM